MPEITLESLAARLEALEKQVAELRQEMNQGPRYIEWRATLGMFAGDEAMMEIDRLGQEIRDAQGPEGETEIPR